MKKLIYTLIIFVFFLTNLSAQWEILNEGFKGSINTIDFVNENVGWILKSEGEMLKTIDGGENWSKIPSNNEWEFGMVDFVSENIGWATGWLCEPQDPMKCWDIIIKTDDGYQNWSIKMQILHIGLSYIYAIDENNVYAVGGNKIYKTSDGGTYWIDVSPNLKDREYNSLWFQNSKLGVITGKYWDVNRYKGIITKTTDGGVTWSETIVNEFHDITGLQFLDSANGYFKANFDTTNFLCKTEDICSSWAVITQGSNSFTSFQFLNKNIVYAIVSDSITSNNILKSSDGGVNWKTVLSLKSSGFWLTKIFFNNSSNGFIIGGFPRGSIMYRSTDGGNEWIIKKFDYPLNDISFIDKDRGILIGGFSAFHESLFGYTFFTTDGGVTWNTINYLRNVLRASALLNEFIAFTIASRFVIVGIIACEILKTTNFGNNWIQVYENKSDSTGLNFFGNDIYFMNDNIGWAVGRYRGAGILKTTDGGKNWELGWSIPETIYLEYNLNSIHCADTICWSVGEVGMILKYTPQTSWVKKDSVTDLPLNKVFFSDDNHGWIAGGYENENDFQNILLKTINGGDSWEKVQNVPYLIKDIVFLDNNFGWAIGYDSSGVGGILKSTDGGNTWTIDTGNLSAKLNALHIKDGYGWAVGENGLILRTTNAGPTWVENENQTLPTEFMLEQNFPNPFNPSTKIKYSIPNVGTQRAVSVQIKVYDVLGREVATLVNEEKPPGVYEVEFDGTNLSSGIYLFRLKATPIGGQAGDFSAVKKMLLLK